MKARKSKESRYMPQDIAPQGLDVRTESVEEIKRRLGGVMQELGMAVQLTLKQYLTAQLYVLPGKGSSLMILEVRCEKTGNAVSSTWTSVLPAKHTKK